MQSAAGISFSNSQFSHQANATDAVAKAERHYTVSVEELQKNAFILLQDSPCQITELHKINDPQKPCIEITAVDLFSGSTSTERLQLTGEVQMPVIECSKLTVMNIAKEGDGYDILFLKEDRETFMAKLYVRNNDQELKQDLLAAIDDGEESVVVDALTLMDKCCITGYNLHPIDISAFDGLA